VHRVGSSVAEQRHSIALVKPLDLMVPAAIVHEVTSKWRNRSFAYSKYLALLDRATEPLPPV